MKHRYLHSLGARLDTGSRQSERRFPIFTVTEAPLIKFSVYIHIRPEIIITKFQLCETLLRSRTANQSSANAISGFLYKENPGTQRRLQSEAPLSPLRGDAL